MEFIPAFHEAIGEAIGLSVGTPKHLQSLGLVQNSVEDSAVDINFLYSMALDKVVFLPFAYVVDKWRYDVFKGNIGKDQYNCHWWRLRYYSKIDIRALNLFFQRAIHGDQTPGSAVREGL